MTHITFLRALKRQAKKVTQRKNFLKHMKNQKSKYFQYGPSMLSIQQCKNDNTLMNLCDSTRIKAKL